MVAQVKMNILFVAIILITSFCVVESKRGINLARGRKKVVNTNVRRKTQGSDTNLQPSAPNHSTASRKTNGWNADNNPDQPVGPPPAYPGMGHNSVPSHLAGAPPAYSASHINPPSYSAATGNSYANIARIPPRGTPYQGLPDSTSFHGISYGQNAYGGPSHTSGLYTNNGMGMGGFSGLGTYGSGYGYGQRSSPLSFGNILTGLAIWNIARGFNSHNRPQHIYIHREKNEEKPLEPSLSDVSNSTQISDHLLEPVVNVTPSECLTCSESTEVFTEIPSDDGLDFVTYHPSLLNYAREFGYQADAAHYYNEQSGNIIKEESFDIPESTTNFEEAWTLTEDI